MKVKLTIILSATILIMMIFRTTIASSNPTSLDHETWYYLYFSWVFSKLVHNMRMRKPKARVLTINWILWTEGVIVSKLYISFRPTMAVPNLSVKPCFLTPWKYLGWSHRFPIAFEFSKVHLHQSQTAISCPNKNVSSTQIQAEPDSAENNEWILVCSF